MAKAMVQGFARRHGELRRIQMAKAIENAILTLSTQRKSRRGRKG